MKIFLSLFVFLTLSAWGYTEKTHYNISAGRLHSGGKASAEILKIEEVRNAMIVDFKYAITKRNLVPVPSEYLKGHQEMELPLNFLDERGYLELERVTHMSLTKADLFFLKRADMGVYKNGYLVRLKLKNGDSESDVFYHPQLPGLGWGKVRIIIHTNVALFGDYLIEAQIIE